MITSGMIIGGMITDGEVIDLPEDTATDRKKHDEKPSHMIDVAKTSPQPATANQMTAKINPQHATTSQMIARTRSQHALQRLLSEINK